MITNCRWSTRQVAETLYQAQIKGRRRDVYDCPVARYIAARVREHLPDNVPVTVSVGDNAFVDFDVPGSDGYRTIQAVVPRPVAEFIKTFDSTESDEHDLYANLVSPAT